MKVEVTISYRFRCMTCAYVAEFIEMDEFLEGLEQHLDSSAFHDIEIKTIVKRA